MYLAPAQYLCWGYVPLVLTIPILVKANKKYQEKSIYKEIKKHSNFKWFYNYKFVFINRKQEELINEWNSKRIFKII